ncbi:MAG: hypothetical protein R3293_13765 [Candidatus Promineifilaceae bacterium]|nr:hypothetical protein [Candidatus Promineifilaceae bacterium]
MSPVSEDEFEGDHALETEPSIEPSSPTFILFYGTLTLLIIIALFWLMNTLSHSPTIVATGPLSTEWVSLHDPEKQFLINIPAQWQWEFAPAASTEQMIDTRLQNIAWSTPAISPLGTIVPDSEIALLAGNNSVLMVIATSQRLSRLAAQQAVDSLQQEDFDGVVVEDARQRQTTAGNIAAYFTIRHTTPPLFCRQLFVPGAQEAYIVAACAPASRANQFADDFNRALNSFQLFGN